MPVALAAGLATSFTVIGLHPGLLGGAAGVLAGSLAAFASALHCPLDATASILPWYPLAIAMVSLASAGIASRVLAW